MRITLCKGCDVLWIAFIKLFFVLDVTFNKVFFVSLQWDILRVNETPRAHKQLGKAIEKELAVSENKMVDNLENENN